MLGCNRFQRCHRFRWWFIAGCLTKTTVRHNPRQPKSQCSTFHPPSNPIPNRSRFISQLLTYCNHSRRNSQLWQTQQGRPTLLCIRPDHFISIQNGALALLDHERNHLFSSVYCMMRINNPTATKNQPNRPQPPLKYLNSTCVHAYFNYQIIIYFPRVLQEHDMENSTLQIN